MHPMPTVILTTADAILWEDTSTQGRMGHKTRSPAIAEKQPIVYLLIFSFRRKSVMKKAGGTYTKNVFYS